MYKLTPQMYEFLKQYEWKNWLKIFDSSEKWFVLWFGMTKDEAIKRGIIEKKENNPLRELCKKNEIIPYKWIQDNLTEDQYDMFLHFMTWQWQSKYWVFNDDLLRFLTNNQI